MRIRKQIWAISLIVFSLGLAGCSDAGDSGKDSTNEPAKDTDSVTIGFVAKALDSDFWVVVTDGAKSVGEADPSVIVNADAGTSEAAIEEQIQKIENLLTKGVDVIAVAPTAPDQLIPVLKSAVDQGVPVILVDTDIPEFAEASAYVGTDNVNGGREAAKFIKEQMPEGGTIGLIGATAGVTSVEDRIQGIKEGLEGSNIEIVSQLKAEGNTRDNGVTAAEDLLTAHPDVKAIFCAGDEPCLGAVEAYRATGRPFSDVIIVGFDGSPAAAESILKGEMRGSVAQFPAKMGSMAVEAAVKLARGGTIDKRIDTGVTIVNIDNVADFQ